MEFRSIFVANPAQLSVRRNQLVIRQEKEVTVPMEDISSLLIESRAVTITAAALQELADHGVTVYICDNAHMPAALTLPMNQNCRQLKLLKSQIAMTLPTKKRTWQTATIWFNTLFTPEFAVEWTLFWPINAGFSAHSLPEAQFGFW